MCGAGEAMEDRTPEKKQHLLQALGLGMVMVHLDARRPGVVVPPEFRTESHLRLNLSYRFHPPDLSVGEWGIRSTLRFSGKRFTVAIPWSAVFAIISHSSQEFWTFPEDMPPELTRSSAGSRPRHINGDVGPAPLRDVSESSIGGDAEDSEQSQPRGRGHLRVVK